MVPRLLAVLLLVAAPALHAQADIQISPADVTLGPGEQSLIEATAFTDAGDVVAGSAYRWTTTDTAVVKVMPRAQGIATLVGIGPGAAVIEARVGRTRGFTTVTVRSGRDDPVPAESPATTEARRRFTACSRVGSRPLPGAWAEWITPRGKIRLAMLGVERPVGETVYRVELTHSGDGGTLLQLLTPSWPHTGERLHEVIEQIAGQPPMRLTGQRLQAARMQGGAHPLRALAERCRGMTAVDTGTVAVPAGAFTTIHLREPDGSYEAWIDPDAPFALVKASGAGGAVELAGHGDGAVSGLNGNPARP